MNLFGEEKMLALSWKQPFAAAMLIGKVETRVWATKYRGSVLICSSLKGYSSASATGISGDWQYRRLLDALWPTWIDKTSLFGMAIAVGRLIDSREMRPDDEDATFVQYRAPWVEERAGKDGRVRKLSRRLYCHIYQDVRPIEPFIWSGSQGWSEVPPAVVEMIEPLGTPSKLPI
jgi:hypothetical protein